MPLFKSDNFATNLAVVEELRRIADTQQCQPGQIALAWLTAQGKDIFPIPGTKRRTYLKENIESVDVTLSKAEIDRIDLISKRVKGKRKNAIGMKLVDQA